LGWSAALAVPPPFEQPEQRIAAVARRQANAVADVVFIAPEYRRNGGAPSLQG